MRLFRLSALLAGLFVASAPLAGAADDIVTISRDRLRELEKKEAELKKLKEGESSQPAHAPSAAPGVSALATAVPPPAESRPAVPSLKSLPPVQPGDIVEASTLAAHYRADATAAAERYERKQRIQVRGEVLAFERVMMTRQFKIVLKTAEPDVRVIAELSVPEEYEAVYTIKSGSELVGDRAKAQVSIAKVGGTVVLEGVCKGIQGNVVKMSKARL